MATAVAVGCSAIAGAAGAPLVAMVAAAGLGALSVTDWADHRLPAPLVRVTAMGVAVAILLPATRAGASASAERAIWAAVAVAVIAGLAWLAFPGAMAFGDVKVLVIASATAAAVSWPALALTLLAAPVATGVTAFAARALCPGSARPVTVPLLPGLAAAFILGVIV